MCHQLIDLAVNLRIYFCIHIYIYMWLWFRVFRETERRGKIVTCETPITFCLLLLHDSCRCCCCVLSLTVCHSVRPSVRLSVSSSLSSLSVCLFAFRLFLLPRILFMSCCDFKRRRRRRRRHRPHVNPSTPLFVLPTARFCPPASLLMATPT